MKLKEINEVEVYPTINGMIALKQINDEGVNLVFLTLEQFKKITNWVDANKKEINKAWNNGIDLSDEKGDADEN